MPRFYELTDLDGKLAILIDSFMRRDKPVHVDVYYVMAHHKAADYDRIIGEVVYGPEDSPSRPRWTTDWKHFR